jgi:hypothetical protein
MHEKEWEHDLAAKKSGSRELDAFFVCSPADGCVGRWLGRHGPEIGDRILGFLKTCSVHGQSGALSKKNRDATAECPIVHWGARGPLYAGLHLETDGPEKLVALSQVRIDVDGLSLEDGASRPRTTEPIRTCGRGGKART